MKYRACGGYTLLHMTKLEKLALEAAGYPVASVTKTEAAPVCVAAHQLRAARHGNRIGVFRADETGATRLVVLEVEEVFSPERLAALGVESAAEEVVCRSHGDSIESFLEIQEPARYARRAAKAFGLPIPEGGFPARQGVPGDPRQLVAGKSVKACALECHVAKGGDALQVKAGGQELFRVAFAATPTGRDNGTKDAVKMAEALTFQTPKALAKRAKRAKRDAKFRRPSASPARRSREEPPAPLAVSLGSSPFGAALDSCK